MRPFLAAVEEVVGDRRNRYDTPQNNFTRVAALWSVVLARPVTVQEVALCLILLKVARQTHSPDPDHWLDIAGYACCGAELEAAPEEKEP